MGLNIALRSASADILKNGVLGGPESASVGISSRDSAVLYALQNPGTIKDDINGKNDEFVSLLSGDQASISNKGSVFSSFRDREDGLLTYKVQPGDNLSKIAAQFGISLNTILWANPQINKGILGVGEELAILPVSGVLYKAKDGDSLESIASAFGVSVSKLKSVNKIANPLELKSDTNIIVPGGKPQRTLASIANSLPQLPRLDGFFKFPMPGNSWNWGVLHSTNAVDIANVCGTLIYAAADGLVLKVGSPDKWNSGYGGYVTLEHNNGTKTTYAHTKENLVQVGDFIEKGSELGKVGNTGNVLGSTGCHLHFEVEGARNPFVK